MIFYHELRRTISCDKKKTKLEKNLLKSFEVSTEMPIHKNAK